VTSDEEVRKTESGKLKFRVSAFRVSAFTFQRFRSVDDEWHTTGLTACMLLLGFRGFRRLNRRGFVSFSHLGLMAGIALGTATVVGGSGYLIRELHRQAGVAWTTAGLPESARPAIVQPVITGDMLHVSSITLGRAPMAVVNGVFVSEGTSIRMQTPDGNVDLRVGKIRDGAVEFRYGKEIISVNLGQPITKK
jgi:hypothetical protein